MGRDGIQYRQLNFYPTQIEERRKKVIDVSDLRASGYLSLELWRMRYFSRKGSDGMVQRLLPGASLDRFFCVCFDVCTRGRRFFRTTTPVIFHSYHIFTWATLPSGNGVEINEERTFLLLLSLRGYLVDVRLMNLKVKKCVVDHLPNASSATRQREVPPVKSLPLFGNGSGKAIQLAA